MKKSFYVMAVLLSLLMVLTACGATAGADVTAPATESADGTSGATEAADDTSGATESADATTTATEETQSVDISGMLPVIDAVICAMEQTGSAYAPRDEAFFWTTLYLISVNDGVALEMAELSEDGQIMVQLQAMREFATACFEDYDDLLAIPENMGITYDEGWDAYFLTASDSGDAVTELLDVASADETVTVRAQFTGSDKVYTITLVPNPYADETNHLSFSYSVSAVTAD